jgi:hypothetical protein
VVARVLIVGAVVLTALSHPRLASAQTASATTQSTVSTAPPRPNPNDYSDSRSWLCRPGGKDACAIDETATIVAADAKLTRETWAANPNAPIDCFYVYPTISTDSTLYSDMSADAAEINVIKQQFARFASQCRPYAPLYRQLTVAGLRRLMADGGGGTALARDAILRGVAYDDVRDAWNYYLEHDNKGRGVVLVGHSQGSSILLEIIRREIDGKSIQSRMVSAILAGTNIAVPRGKDVGGSFQHVPLCHSATQTGCVITYASFRSTIPPPPSTLYGKVPAPDMVAACTNPAALAGGSGDLHAYLDTTGQTITRFIPVKPWVTPDRPIKTPWVSVPGLLSAECASNANASGYLEVTVHGNPSDPRIDDIIGDVPAENGVLAQWGLHLIDINLAMGSLIDIVAQQAKAFGLASPARGKQ